MTSKSIKKMTLSHKGDLLLEVQKRLNSSSRVTLHYHANNSFKNCLKLFSAEREHGIHCSNFLPFGHSFVASAVPNDQHVSVSIVRFLTSKIQSVPSPILSSSDQRGVRFCVRFSDVVGKLHVASRVWSRFTFWKKAFPNSYVLIITAHAGATLITRGMKPAKRPLYPKLF